MKTLTQAEELVKARQIIGKLLAMWDRVAEDYNIWLHPEDVEVACEAREFLTIGKGDVSTPPSNPTKSNIKKG